jgi:two-component system sensor histidine kinase VicK
MNESNNQLFCQMGEISKDGYFIYSTFSRHFKYLNNSIANIWEIDAQEINIDPGHLLKAVHTEDLEHARNCYIECQEDMEAKKYEIRLMFIGREKYLRVSVFPLEIENEALLCGIVEDITVAKHNKIHIEQINAHKNVTLEVLSHDLKEPLGMMRLTANAMEKELAKIGNPDILNSLSFIQEMCERNIKLVRSMVNHEFLKSSVIELKKERTDIVWEIQDIVRFYKKSHLRELREFRFNTSDEKIFLFLDSMKFLQVVNNLISNSIKFTPYAGIIEVDIQNKENSVIVSVADNGIGIPKAFQDGLFDRGEKGLKRGLTGEETGGLGLGIAKSIVALHGGNIWLESEEGKGTIFYIELPKE